MRHAGWYADPQWARALGAVALSCLVVFGVARAGGPLALVGEAHPVDRIVVEWYCAAAVALRQDGPVLARDPRRGG